MTDKSQKTPEEIGQDIVYPENKTLDALWESICSIYPWVGERLEEIRFRAISAIRAERTHPAQVVHVGGKHCPDCSSKISKDVSPELKEAIRKHFDEKYEPHPAPDVREALEAAYVENQNMHCFETKGKLKEALNAQTKILRATLSLPGLEAVKCLRCLGGGETIKLSENKKEPCPQRCDKGRVWVRMRKQVRG